MSRGAERPISGLPITPDPYEEALTPRVPGQGVLDFQPLPGSHFDPADHADFVMHSRRDSSYFLKRSQA